MSADEPVGREVKLYVYDLTKGVARSMSQAFLGKQLDGIWHTSIVVFAREYFFGGGGIETCRPGGTILGNPDNVVELGDTFLDYPLFYEYISNLREDMFSGEKYHLFDHNCNTFSNEIAQFLTGNEIPEYITSLPQEVLDTPLGALIKPLIDSMTTNPVPPRTNSYLEPIPQPSYLQDDVPSQASAAAPDDQAKVDDQRQVNGTEVNGVGADIKASDDAEIPVKPKLPVVSKKHMFTDAKPGECVQCILGNLPEGMLTEEEKMSLEALRKYLDEDMDLTGIPNNGFLAVGKLLQTMELPPCVLVAVLDLLQLAFLNLDVVRFMLSNDDPVMMTFVNDLNNKTIDVQVAAIKMLCNVCKWGQGYTWLVSEQEWTLNGATTRNCTITCSLITSALLCQNMQLMEVAATLVNNMAQHEVSEDIAIELGSAMLQCITTVADIAEGTAFFCLGGLYGLMQHGEVTCLASVMGLDPQKYASRSQRLEILCGDMLSVMNEN
ncbi:uncharacterized protein [Antedon mediterranea]|uniref:uncharacterized protein n=1 Tax=Antedon mediterranea TaxID=105859 RepID=UPI003AF69648